MKKKIGFIAVGQAGGNIGKLFEQRGFSVLYINTSKEDLDITKGKYKYHIKNGEGCSKNRNKAKELIIKDFENIVKEYNSKIESEMVYIIFAMGGGTGSGASPMLAELLLNDGEKVGLISILPAKNESIKTQLNAYECFSEIEEIDDLSSVFILDNEGRDKLHINNEFVSLFTNFVLIPDKNRDIRGNIDKSEIEEVLSAQGMSIIVRDIANRALEKINNNIFAKIEDDGSVKYIAASLSGNDSVDDIEKIIGIPFDNFKTYNKEKTLICLSGLTYPSSRFKEIYNLIESNRTRIKKSLNSNKEKVITKGIDLFSDEKQLKKTAKKKKDIFEKYLK